MSDKPTDREMLEARWNSLRDFLEALDEIGPQDLCEPGKPWHPSEDDDRCYGLALQYKVDGHMFIDPPPTLEGNWAILWMEKNARKQMRAIRAILPKLPKEQPKGDEIPPEFRTRPMSYRMAAQLLRGFDSMKNGEWLSKSVLDGLFKCIHVTRQTHVFDIRKFPEDKQPLVAPRK